ncbi:MAG: hypothetical protein NWE99_09165 [Candidatus Bathyarchaeota archaeon]|nr:hypothetical protein [Candidatus Bathyarchaeota archaeon]
MPDDLCRKLLEDFLRNSWTCVKDTVEALAGFSDVRKVVFFWFKNGRKTEQTFEGTHFFLRSSVEYSNPQLTVEEVQGIIGARMLEACGNHFHAYGLKEPDTADFDEICEALKKPPEGLIVPFLLNTDDIEPDRYSMNPMRKSIVASGQSAFPVAYVKPEPLVMDKQFLSKYEGKLLAKSEAELINSYHASAKDSYLDFVDSVKYAEMDEFSQTFGINLSLPALRMPLATLQAEDKSGLLHHIIRETHRDYEAVSQAYSCMGRSMAKRTTLLTVPHSKKGYGSKRAARGRLHFNEANLESVHVKYETTPLYPNSVDPDDVSIAEAEDDFTVAGEKLAQYNFKETPSSPQFFLYSLGSPENGVVWHGIGAYAAPQLLHSYVSVHNACMKQLTKDLKDMYGVKTSVPMQFNLAPEGMWVHPLYHNIDAGIGTVGNPSELVRRGMKIEHLSAFK